MAGRFSMRIVINIDVRAVPILAAIIVAGLCVYAHADEITLIDGTKQTTDKIVGLRGRELITLPNGQAGNEVRIAVSKVTAFQIDAPPQARLSATNADAELLRWDPAESSRDLITFANGDQHRGLVLGYRDRKMMIVLNGQRIAFAPNAVQGFEIQCDPTQTPAGLDTRMKPPEGVTDMVQRAAGVDTESDTRDLGEERKLVVVAEKGMSVPTLMMGAISASFYSQRGCYIKGLVRNDSIGTYQDTQNLTRIRGYDFVIEMFDANDQLITSQRFYVFRFPVGRPVPFTVHLPHLTWEQVAKVEVKRKF